MTLKLGAFAQPQGTQAGNKEAFTDLETKLGRKLFITRHYLNWADNVAKQDFITWSANQGKIPLIAWHPFDGDGHGAACTWNDITAGSQDALIRGQAQALKALDKPVWFCFHHEPEDDLFTNPAGQAQCGKDGTEFKQAWLHVKHVMESVGVPKVTFLATFMAGTFGTGHGGPSQWFPPETQLYGVDGYNRGGVCGLAGWSLFPSIFQKAASWAQTNGKPLIIQETGTPEQKSGATPTKTDWFNDMRSQLKSWPQIKALCYSHVSAKCEFYADTTSGSFTAFKAMANDAYFAG